MLTADTKRRIDSCRDILVGKLPLPTDQVELITLALIYKFMDDLDEESVAMGGKRSFFTGPLAAYRWRALTAQTVSADERMTRFADGLELLGGGKKLRVPKKNGKKGEEEEIDPAAHLPALFRDIFRNAFLKFRDGRILTLFLTELGGFAYSHSEELGNAFEYILQCMGAQGDNGQFRTPRHIIDFMVACLDPSPTDKILDPACGTGGFLVSAFKHILAQHTSPGSTLPGDRLGHEQRQRLYGNITGYDTNDQMVKLSRVNLFLHQFASPTIHIYDTLTNDARWAEKADLILANPPFMTPKGGVVPHTRFRIPAKKSEVLFTDYIAEHLTPDGRAGVIVPNGIVATTQNAYVKLRRFLVEDSLVAVVSLPAGCFKPYSGVKTSILFLDKKLARQTDKILFLKISADGFDLGDQRHPVAANDLPEAAEALKSWFATNGADRVAPSTVANVAVTKAELLADRSVSLSSERYFGETVAATTDHPIVPLGDVLHFMRNGCDVEQRVEPGKFRVSRIQSIADGTFNPEKTKWTDDEVAPDRFLQRGDILLSHINSVPHLAKTALFRGCTEPVIHGINLLCLRPNQEFILPEFLSVWLKTDAFVRKAVTYAKRAVNQASITTADLKGIEIPLPPLEEQRRIVAEIEGYQHVIGGARQILAAYQPDLQVDPEWEMKALGEIADVKLGKMLDKTKHRSGRVMPYLRNTNVRWGSIETDDLLEMYFEEDEMERFGLRKGDVLVCEGGEPGRAAVWDGRMPDLKYQKALHRVRFKVPYEPKLLVYYLQALARTKEWDDRFHGATIKHFTREMFIELPIPLPPLPEQERIVAELDAEAARLEAVRGLIPDFEAKIQRVLARVWGAGV